MLDFTYESFDEETKKYLNKAMDIYSTIKDKEIRKKVIFLRTNKLYTFVKLDKKILSLFIASFYSPKLSEILEEYNDLKLSDLFDFIDTKAEDIKQLDMDKYNEFYDKNIKLDLMSIIKEKETCYNIKALTKETIFFSLEGDGASIISSDIMNFFGQSYGIKEIWFCNHPIFKSIKNYAKEKGLLQEKNYQNSKITLYNYNNYDNNYDKIIKEILEKYYPTPEKSSITTEEKIDLESEELWNILDDIKVKFIGQERAAEYLFYNIVNNQNIVNTNDTSDGERSIIFLDGSTGTGKTAITREITKRLDIPFTATSVVNYSATGYVGGDITDTLKQLYKKASGDLQKAERGIIVLDEFDKISYNSQNNGLEMKKAVQQQLLDFMGGGKYEIAIGDNPFNRRKIAFDTSKLTFICLAALTDLRDKKTNNKPLIGFSDREEVQENESYTITPEDLIDLGFERELVGRFNVYLHTDEYSKESLLRILKESTISPLIGFKRWINSRNKKLIIEDGVYETIAESAYDLNTGARSLQTVMNNIRTPFLKEVLRGKEETIYLDVDTVKKITEETVKRKVRK